MQAVAVVEPEGGRREDTETRGRWPMRGAVVDK